ncbi:MAG TPA: 30S ribosome-binding factor RbfA [bacterium]|nr:30S ribosome-binding factor RbfA [bacterium]
MRRRAKRAGRLIQEEISKIIQRELKDPRIGFVTVTGVDITDDLRYAKVFITVLKRENKKKTLKGLERAKGFIRREIGQRIKMRFTPEIEFRFDEAIEQGAHIEDVLRNIATAKVAKETAKPAEKKKKEGEKPATAEDAEKPAENAEIKKDDEGRK